MFEGRLLSLLCVVQIITLLAISGANTLQTQAIEDFGEQLSCMIDYLEQVDRKMIDIYFEVPLSGKCPMYCNSCSIGQPFGKIIN